MRARIIFTGLFIICALSISGSVLFAVDQTATVQSPAESPKKYVSLDMRNVDINTVLQVFAKETGLSIVAGKNVYGIVTITLNNVEVDQALNAILKANGYSYKKEGNVVTIISAEEPVRIQELPDGVYVATFIVNYIEPDKLKDTLLQLMPPGPRLYTTEGNKTLVLKGSLADIKRADNLIRDIDIPPKQVMVESQIIEVSLNSSTKMGTNLKYINPNNANEIAQTVNLAGAPTDSGAKGLYYSITNSNPESLVEALATRTGFNILSSPKVIALNEQTAEIITGSRLGYRVKTVTTTGMIESIEFLDVGTKLMIKPSIKSDGLIIMDIHPEISEGKIENDLPQKNSTETTTRVVVRDGQTVIIGGLVRDSENKEVNGIPLLMDIPIIGAFFKRTDLTTEKKEVIVIIRPTIINQDDIDQMEEKINEMNAKRRNLTPQHPADLFK